MNLKLPLIIFFVLLVGLCFLLSEPEHEVAQATKPKQKDMRPIRLMDTPSDNQVKLIETRGHVVSTIPAPKYPNEAITEWIDLGPAWEQEMQRSLHFVDAQHGEAIYQAYRKEVEEHQLRLNGNVKENIKTLRGMNGESAEADWGEDEPVLSIQQYNRLHAENVKKILGEHYSYILEQREAFINKN